MKKAFAILSLLLTFSLIAGCGSKTTKKETTNKIVTTRTTTSVKTTENLNKKELISEAEAKTWQDSARYTIIFQGYEYTIGDEKDEDSTIHKGLDILLYDENLSKKFAADERSDDLVGFVINEELKDKLFQNLVSTFGVNVTDGVYFDFEEFVMDIIVNAQKMNTTCSFNLVNYLNKNWSDTIVDCIEIVALDEDTVNKILAVFKNKEIVIPKNTSATNPFSFVEYICDNILPNDELKSNDYSIVATGIAALTFRSNLKVVEKHQGYVSDRYYAFNDMTARVNYKDNTDLKIYNSFDTDYVITIEQGRDDIVTGSKSLRFNLFGCMYIDKYECTKNCDITKNKIIYDEKASDFVFDPDDYLMGVDEEFQGGCYYCIYVEGSDDYFYTYVKKTTKVDGTVFEENIFSEPESYYGRDEYRKWTKNGYSVDK